MISLLLKEKNLSSSLQTKEKKSMKESKESKNRFVSNGSESFKLKKLKEKDVLKSKKLHRKDKDLT
jgi:hypothetical protein